MDLTISEYIEAVSYLQFPHLGTSDHIAIFVRFNVSLNVPSRKVHILLELCFMESYICGYFHQAQWNILKSEPLSDVLLMPLLKFLQRLMIVT